MRDSCRTTWSRRRVLKAGLSAGAAFATPTIIPSSALGLDGAVPPSERIVVGGIGIGRRGEYDLGCFLEQPDVSFAAIADVKESRRQTVKKIADTKYGTQSCTMHRDFRELLDRKDIDAVLIATGPNWHGLMAMLAAKAGKDIYCEKPCTKNIVESLVHRDTMQRCGTVFQAGTQRRNLPHFAFACELARTGRLGKIKKVHAYPRGLTATMSGWLPAEPERSLPATHRHGTGQGGCAVVRDRRQRCGRDRPGPRSRGHRREGGDHCAQPSLRHFGLEATVRPSLAFYNTTAEVDLLVDVLRRLA